MKVRTEELLDQNKRARIQHDCDELLVQLGNKDTAEAAASEILQLT